MAEQPNIQFCYWDHLTCRINYRCSCGSNIKLLVFRSGQTYMHVEPSLDYPVVAVVWDDDVVHIESTHCNVVIDFQLCDIGGVVEIRI